MKIKENPAAAATRGLPPIGVAGGEPFGATLRRSDVFRADGVAAAVLDAALDSAGALLVSGCSPDDFLAITSALGAEFIVHGSRLRGKTGVDPTVQTVDEGRHAIALHCELSYLPDRPTLVGFYCRRPADRGGETTLADGAQIVRALPPGVRRRLEEQRLRFEHRIPMDMWRPFEQSRRGRPMRLRDGESFEPRIDGAGEALVFSAEYLTPAILPARPGAPPAFANGVLTALDPANYIAASAYRLSFEDGSAIPDELAAELRAAADSVTVDVPWREGDVVLADNLRVLHGRRAFDGERALWTRFGYRRDSLAA